MFSLFPHSVSPIVPLDRIITSDATHAYVYICMCMSIYIYIQQKHMKYMHSMCLEKWYKRHDYILWIRSCGSMWQHPVNTCPKPQQIPEPALILCVSARNNNVICKEVMGAWEKVASWKNEVERKKCHERRGKDVQANSRQQEWLSRFRDVKDTPDQEKVATQDKDINGKKK